MSEVHASRPITIGVYQKAIAGTPAHRPRRSKRGDNVTPTALLSEAITAQSPLSKSKIPARTLHPNESRTGRTSIPTQHNANGALIKHAGTLQPLNKQPKLGLRHRKHPEAKRTALPPDKILTARDTVSKDAVGHDRHGAAATSEVQPAHIYDFDASDSDVVCPHVRSTAAHRPTVKRPRRHLEPSADAHLTARRDDREASLTANLSRAPTAARDVPEQRVRIEVVDEPGTNQTPARKKKKKRRLPVSELAFVPNINHAAQGDLQADPQSSDSEPGEEDPIDDRQADPLVHETGPKRRTPSSARRKPLSALQKAIKKPRATDTTQLDLSPFKVIKTVIVSSQSSASSHDGFIGSELFVPPRPVNRRRSKADTITFHGTYGELCLAVGSPPVTFSAGPLPDGHLLVQGDPITVSSAPLSNSSSKSGMLASEFGDLSLMEPQKRSAEAYTGLLPVSEANRSTAGRKRGREMTQEEVFRELAQITAPARSRSESAPDDTPAEGEETEAEAYEENESEDEHSPAPSRLHHRRYTRSIRTEPVEDIEMLDEENVLIVADATHRDRNRNGSGYRAQYSRRQDVESGEEAYLPGQAARMESDGAWMEVSEEILDDTTFVIHATQVAPLSQGSTLKSIMKTGSKNARLPGDESGAGTCLVDRQGDASIRIEVPESSHYFSTAERQLRVPATSPSPYHPSSHGTRCVEETDDELLEPGVPSDTEPPMQRGFSLIRVHPRPDLVSATKHTGPPKHLKTLTEAARHELGTTPAGRRRTASLRFKPLFKAHQKSND